jgi:hypothetical protein
VYISKVEFRFLKLAILVEGVADTLLYNVIGGCARLSMGTKEGDILID